MRKGGKEIAKRADSGLQEQQQEILSQIRQKSLSLLKAAMENSEDVVLCLDVSGSMVGERIAALKKAVKGFILAKGKINPRDRIGMVTFGRGAKIVFDLTENREEIKEKILALEANNGTPMGEALSLTREILSKPIRRQSRVILLSDGCANGPDDPGKTRQEARLLAKLKVTIDTIGISAGSTAEFDENFLKEIAEITGGIYSRVEDISKLPEKFVKLAPSRAMLSSGTGKEISLLEDFGKEEK